MNEERKKRISKAMGEKKWKRLRAQKMHAIQTGSSGSESGSVMQIKRSQFTMQQ
jgi:hypothetical protein